MHYVAMILTVLVALEHFFILWLEMFASDSKLAEQSFGIPRSILGTPAVQLLFKNQGLYNGFLAAGLLYALFVVPAATATGVTLFFLACVIVAAIFGAATVTKRIIIVQGIPAMLAFLLMAYFY